MNVLRLFVQLLTVIFVCMFKAIMKVRGRMSRFMFAKVIDKMKKINIKISL